MFVLCPAFRQVPPPLSPTALLSPQKPLLLLLCVRWCLPLLLLLLTGNGTSRLTWHLALSGSTQVRLFREGTMRAKEELRRGPRSDLRQQQQERQEQTHARHLLKSKIAWNSCSTSNRGSITATSSLLLTAPASTQRTPRSACQHGMLALLPLLTSGCTPSTRCMTHCTPTTAAPTALPTSIRSLITRTP